VWIPAGTASGDGSHGTLSRLGAESLAGWVNMVRMRRRPNLLMLPTLLTLTAVALMGVALTGCGGKSKDPGVASLQSATSGSPGGTASATTTGAATGKAAEAQLLKYIECLRGQGLDIPDPTVDADGNLTFGGGKGGPPKIDPGKLQAAQKVCGPVPASALGGIDPDSSKFQDAAVKFAACMRKEGVDVPDPDFSKGGIGGIQGLFKNLDQSDPKVTAALQKCRVAFAGVGPAASGGNG
jgi:hypothetical protein